MTSMSDDRSVVGKVMAVLHAFGPEDHALSLAGLVRRTGLSKTTVRRLLADLVGARLLERDGDELYHLGSHLFELGMRASVEQQLHEVAVPFLQDLTSAHARRCTWACSKAARLSTCPRLGATGRPKTPSRVGGRMPLHCTAIGKVLLAHAREGPVSRGGERQP